MSTVAVQTKNSVPVGEPFPGAEGARLFLERNKIYQISSKSNWNVLCYHVHRQTDRHITTKLF